MVVKEINKKEIWENFLLECEEKTFLSSWNWGEFNKMMGNKIWRLGVYEADTGLTCVALGVKIQAKRGTFLFVPHGPNIKSKIKSRAPTGEAGDECKAFSDHQKSKILEILLKELKKIAKDESTSFIRISPIWERNEENIKVFKDLGFRNAPIHMHPELTWELDIRASEDELLMGMRKTTRYLIRQAQKNKDIEITQSQKLEDVKKFNQLYQETVDRHHFVPFSLDYLKNEFLAFAPDGQISIFLGKYSPPHQNFGGGGKNEIISSGIFIFWQDIAFYHHGASLLKYPKIPVSYLLQWEAIREAKKRGCKTFNFWGVAPISIINNQLSIINKKHPWAGLTLFKMGFGGYKKEYLKTQDFPLSKKYWLTYLFEKLRRKKRGL